MDIDLQGIGSADRQGGNSQPPSPDSMRETILRDGYEKGNGKRNYRAL